MNPLRRGTPDSEAMVSSGDEGPWPSSSFGSLPPRRDSNVPGLPGNIWARGPRGSFSGTANAAQAMYSVRGSSKGRVAPPASIIRSVSTPSPANSDGSGQPAFTNMPMKPTPKVVRSMSHSQGQQEAPQKPLQGLAAGSQPAALPLGLLAEEADAETESESELGDSLTQSMSNPLTAGSLQRTSTFPSAYGMSYSHGSGMEDPDEYDSLSTAGKFGSRLEHALTSVAFDPPARRPQWHTSLGWDDLPNPTESRRHSLADIPTRRGSLAGEQHPGGATGLNDGSRGARDLVRANTLDEGAFQIDTTNRAHLIPHSSAHPRDTADRYGLPAQYHVPPVILEPHERTPRPLPPSNPNNRAPRKLLYIVSFKCARVECFYLLENTGLEVNEGDMVIVEADRGQDLGMVQHARVTPEEARILKRKYAEEQYKWLMMFSQNNQQGAVNPNAPGANRDSNSQAESGALGGARGGANPSPGGMPSRPYPVPGAVGGPMLNKEDIFNLKPKAIKRIANANEVRMLMDKEGNEAKAKRSCQTKVNICRLDMEILDAEWQWDFNKIIFYYYADHYINFQALITELYRIYKTRIWLSAVNPASFSPAATGQMPFGFGPGAILGNQYGGQYGVDPDPHGAVRPYNLEFNTYDPNYPAIPGMPNSFPNVQGGAIQAGGMGPYSPPPHQYQPHGAPTTMTQDFGNRQMGGGYNSEYLSMMSQFGGVSLGNTQQSPASPAYQSAMPHHHQHQQHHNPAGMNIGAASNTSGGMWLQPGLQNRRESAVRAAGIGRQQNPPAPIGTRPASNGQEAMAALHGGVGGSAHSGALGSAAVRGAGETHGSSRQPMHLTFGAVQYDGSGREGGRAEEEAMPGGEEASVRMRAFLDNGGTGWAR